MIGQTVEPNTEAKLKGTGPCLKFIGIERYTLTEDFKITHIDTDWDMLYGAAQLAGLGPLVRNRDLQKVGLRAASLVAPVFRLATALTARRQRRMWPDGSRRPGH